MGKKQETEDFSFRPFRNLSKTIDLAKNKSAAKETPVMAAPCPDGDELFMLEMKGVREIREFRKIRISQCHITPPPERLDPDQEELTILKDISNGLRPIRLEDTQEYVEWVNSACGSAPISKKLHEGSFAVQDFIDLHGFTVNEAEELIDDFLRSSIMKGLRCVKIIHGRGLKSPQGPVLKEALVGWLSSRYRKNIISFATARQCDGGLGALYILLSRRPVSRR